MGYSTWSCAPTGYCIILNGILLMLITFFDYPTAVLAAAITEGQYQRFAAMFYTGTLLALTIVYNIFWRYIAAHPRLIDAHVSLGAVEKISREYRFGPLFYAAALLVSYFSAVAGVLITLLLAIYFAPHRENRTGPWRVAGRTWRQHRPNRLERRATVGGAVGRRRAGRLGPALPESFPPLQPACASNEKLTPPRYAAPRSATSSARSPPIAV